MHQNQKINPEQGYQTILFVWFALLISQLMFLFIVFFIKPELLVFDLTKPLLGDNAAVVLAFAALSAASVVASIILRNKFLRQSVAEQNIAHVQTAMISGCALAEVASLLGLMLAFAFDYQYFFLFSVAGIVATLLHFQRRSSVHAAAFRQ
jgi:F0F1-type ATP synthase membrane subunit c/vacuolar-type H+-ATPase subunit K